MPLNTDKAYLLGLIVGGGLFGRAGNAFRVRLPFKKWGSYLDNPQRAGMISQDIMKVVSPMFRNTYDLIVSFESTANAWNICCDGDAAALKSDLSYYGISSDGEILANADISGICAELIDDNLKRRFIAGLADTKGSMAKSHRRFTDENQIISFEIKGYNFSFVCDLCRLLHSINCIPDQVNWNHPNIHCSNDPYYRGWNKGFKLRVLLDQYSQFGSFAFRTKAQSSKENRTLQRKAHSSLPCPEQRMTVTPSCVHRAENDARLPAMIRGGHYIHYRHFCAVLGCKHAPFDKIMTHLNRIGELVQPFAILCKGPISRINGIIANDPMLAQRNYRDTNVSVSSLLARFRSDCTERMYGTNPSNGYPIKEILKAVSFVIADGAELFGKRPKGSYLEILERHVGREPGLRVIFRKPDLLTPLIIVGNGRGAMVGPENPNVYETLVTRSPDNKYKLSVRHITEKDLRNA
jgi:hypothetical protein